MKVVIITEGGTNIGYGHVIRSISLYQAFEEKGNVPTMLVNGDQSIGRFLEGNNHQVLDWLREKDKALDLVRGTDIVIVDSYMADHSFYERVSRLAREAVYIDDVGTTEYPKGTVVNGNIYGEAVRYPQKNGIEYLVGPKYSHLRKAFWKVPQKNISDDVTNILLTLGGHFPIDVTAQITALLTKNCSNITKTAVVGDAVYGAPCVDKIRDSGTDIVCDVSAETMKRLMLKADVAISAGGQTVAELARIGLPTIGVCFADNQEWNLRAWDEKGFLRYAGWWNDNDLLSNVFDAVEALMDGSERRERSRIGKGYIDGQGARRICQRLMHKAMRTAKDAE